MFFLVMLFFCSSCGVCPQGFVSSCGRVDMVGRPNDDTSLFAFPFLFVLCPFPVCAQEPLSWELVVVETLMADWMVVQLHLKYEERHSYL